MTKLLTLLQFENFQIINVFLVPTKDFKAFQAWNFFIFSSFGGKFLPARIRIPDLDPLTQLNLDPEYREFVIYCEYGTFSAICIQQNTVTVLLVITF